MSLYEDRPCILINDEDSVRSLLGLPLDAARKSVKDHILGGISCTS